jgi:hypothetical protein
MKLTIVKSDNQVYKDGTCVMNLDLSSCGIPNDVWALQWDNNSGWIEYSNGNPNEDITELPAWATACESVFEAGLALENAEPSDEEKIRANKMRAKFLLESSDWTQLADINITEANKAEWDAYRATLRGIFATPTVDATFPTEPETVWV